MYIDSMNGIITMCVPEFDSSKGKTIYTLGKNGFTKEVSFGGHDEGAFETSAEAVPEDTESSDTDIEEVKEKEEINKYTYFWSRIGETSNQLYSAFFSEYEFLEGSGLGAINGSNFEMLLSKLTEAKPKSQLELKMAYTDFFKEEGIYDDAYFFLVDEEQMYAYDSANNKYYYVGTVGKPATEDDLSDMKNKIDGTEVELSSIFTRECLQEIAVDNIETIEQNNGIITVKTDKGVSLKGNDSYTDSYYDEKKICAWKISIPTDSGYKIIEATYEQVKKYLEEGLATDIEISTYYDYYNVSISEVGIENITITLPNMDTYASILEGEEKEKFIFENEILPAYESYVRENYGDQVCYSFIYLNDDNIPELLISSAQEFWVCGICSYTNNSVISTGVNNRDSWYLEKQNLLYAWGGYESFYDNIYTIKDGAFSCVANGKEEKQYDENGMPFFEYFWNEQSVSEEEYQNLLAQAFDKEKAISTYDLDFYSTIQEAYENLGKEHYSAFATDITKFELTDNILTIETDADYNICYSISEDCTWEQAGLGAEIEFYGTTSYEEIKEKVEEIRQIFVQYNEYESPPRICVDIVDGVIVKVYTLSS